MTTKHVLICDRCGERAENPAFLEWGVIKFNCDPLDMCPGCMASFARWCDVLRGKQNKVVFKNFR